MNFTQTVKELMGLQNINASNLAKKMGYSPQYISDLLAGKKRWNETTMSKACNVLGIKVKFYASQSLVGRLETTLLDQAEPTYR
ncbi:MAG: helix-turn-helix transcriptional regulator [Bacillota bacterium]|nr:helix-turn-helix transcriptional regulator [Bacillota bacterium]